MSKENKNHQIQTLFVILCTIGILLCIVLRLPFVKNALVSFAVTVLTPFVETYIIHRTLNQETLFGIWSNLYSKACRLGFRIFFIADILLFYREYKPHITKRFNLVNIFKVDIDIKSFIKPVLILFAVYVVGIFSIIRANFSYIDDLGHSIKGYRGWDGFSRFLSNYLSIFVHGDKHVTDISPFPQIIACFILAIAGALLIYIFCNKTFTLRTLFASIPLGLSPYFLECISYKFDSPYMALSILFSIVPFIFINRQIAFAVISIVALIFMLMTYQAASGIYIIITIFLIFITWNQKNKSVKEIGKTVLTAIVSYCFAFAFYKVFIVNPVDTYVSDTAYSIKGLFPGIIHNVKSYLSLVNTDFSIIWKVLLLIICVIVSIKSAILTKRNKIASVLLSFISIVLIGVFSFGAYLVLEQTLYEPRAMYGFGVALSLLTIYIADMPRKWFALPSFLLCYCFFTLSLSYGNALADQNRYTYFRVETLAHDIANTFPELKNSGITRIRIIGSIGYSPVVDNIAQRNGVIRRLVQSDSMLSAWRPWGYMLLTEYYHLSLAEDDNLDDKSPAYKTIFDSYYHTIKSNGDSLIIILKNG